MKKPLPALAALALLAACSGSDPEPSADANAAEMLDVTNEAMNVAEAPLVMNAPAPVVDNAVDEPPVVDEAQIQDDADATGMTARVSRDEAPSPAAEGSAPADTAADVSEKKE